LTEEVDIEALFYGGIEGSIGGNTIVIRTKKGERKYSYMFDCGINLERYSRFKDLGIRLETLEQFERWGLLPHISEIGKLNACFISHGHRDHWLVLPTLINSTISPKTIWMTNTTRLNIKAQNMSIRCKSFDNSPFENNYYYYDSDALKDNIKVSVALFPVDHSISGACAYLMETPKGMIIYTGDFRDHGLLSKNLAEQFWDYFKRRSQHKKLEVICEGTNYGLPIRHLSENDVKNRIKEILCNYKNDLVTIIATDNDLWRNVVIRQAVEEVKEKYGKERNIIYCNSIVKSLRGLRECFKQDYRNVLDKSILDYYIDLLNVDEESYLKPSIIAKIIQNPSNYMIVATRREGLKACDDIASKMKYKAIGGCCVLSLSETFEEETGISTREYSKSIAELGFSIEEVHSSGHIFPQRLLTVLRQLNPNRIFVVHTSVPEGLRNYIKTNLDVEVISPTANQSYPLFQ
jgi:mRNA degradation ribonuclease J1/J2